MSCCSEQRFHFIATELSDKQFADKAGETSLIPQSKSDISFPFHWIEFMNKSALNPQTVFVILDSPLVHVPHTQTQCNQHSIYWTVDCSCWVMCKWVGMGHCGAFKCLPGCVMSKCFQIWVLFWFNSFLTSDVSWTTKRALVWTCVFLLADS